MKMRIEDLELFLYSLKSANLRLVNYTIIHHGSIIEIVGGEIKSQAYILENEGELHEDY